MGGVYSHLDQLHIDLSASDNWYWEGVMPTKLSLFSLPKSAEQFCALTQSLGRVSIFSISGHEFSTETLPSVKQLGPFLRKVTSLSFCVSSRIQDYASLILLSWLPHLSKIQTLEVNGHVSPEFLQALGVGLPQLTELRLKNTAFPSDAAASAPFRTLRELSPGLKSMPSLETLVIHSGIQEVRARHLIHMDKRKGMEFLKEMHSFLPAQLTLANVFIFSRGFLVPLALYLIPRLPFRHAIIRPLIDLLNAGGGLDHVAYPGEGVSPLFYLLDTPSSAGHIKLLMAAGADPWRNFSIPLLWEGSWGPHEANALFVAVLRASLYRFKEFLSAINWDYTTPAERERIFRTSMGFTPLHLACRRDPDIWSLTYRTCKLALPQNPLADRRNFLGATPLEFLHVPVPESALGEKPSIVTQAKILQRLLPCHPDPLQDPPLGFFALAFRHWSKALSLNELEPTIHLVVVNFLRNALDAELVERSRKSPAVSIEPDSSSEVSRAIYDSLRTGKLVLPKPPSTGIFAKFTGPDRTCVIA